jgi:hypothetical protein
VSRRNENSQHSRDLSLHWYKFVLKFLENINEENLNFLKFFPILSFCFLTINPNETFGSKAVQIFKSALPLTLFSPYRFPANKMDCFHPLEKYHLKMTMSQAGTAQKKFQLFFICLIQIFKSI